MNYVHVQSKMYGRERDHWVVENVQMLMEEEDQSMVVIMCNRNGKKTKLSNRQSSRRYPAAWNENNDIYKYQ